MLSREYRFKATNVERVFTPFPSQINWMRKIITWERYRWILWRNTLHKKVQINLLRKVLLENGTAKYCRSKENSRVPSQRIGVDVCTKVTQQYYLNHFYNQKECRVPAVHVSPVSPVSPVLLYRYGSPDRKRQAGEIKGFTNVECATRFISKVTGVVARFQVLYWI